MITVVSLPFPESSEWAQNLVVIVNWLKVVNWQYQKLLVTNNFFRVNERRKRMD